MKEDQSKKGLFSRRTFLKSAGGLALASSLSGAELIRPKISRATVIKKQVINIGTFGPSHCSTPLVYSKLAGCFDECGLNVNLINYPSQKLIVKDLLSGKLDLTQMITTLALAVHNGAKPFDRATPLAITSILGVNGAAIMIKKGSGISNVTDFKGKKIANHSKLGVHYLLNMMFLEMYGLDYQKDVDFNIIKIDQIQDAMKQGKIDSFVTPEPRNAMAEHLGIGEPFMLSKYIWPNHPCCALTTRRDFFDKNTELMRELTRSVTKATLQVNNANTREETIDLLRSSSKFKFDLIPKKVLMSAFTPGRADFYPFPYQSSALVLIDIMKKYNILPADVHDRKVAEELFLADYSREIMKELGASPPASNLRVEKLFGRLREFPDMT